ncbi:MAG: type II toxin-antitoxin system RelE/ParE family toxin [Candidatus Omnitrophica bacterium]|nr:type II toxin-antitoxin system RelE/ParE family toxin [Candidatus Omnitrophota bacterium]
MTPPRPLDVVFYRTASGKEPVREWLKALHKTDKRRIGEDIKTVQYGWPLGMPVVRKLEKNLWEVRTVLAQKSARVLFTLEDQTIVLLHGFIKKSRQTPQDDLALAKQRMNDIKKGY